MLVKNNLDELDTIFNELDTLCERLNIPAEARNNLCLCMDEVFSNIVKYAYDDGGEHEIQITFDFEAPRFTITISDGGKPFNPLDAEEPDLSPDLMEREIGGLGLFIVSNIMDDIEYSRVDDTNRLKMLKNI
ncbi:MAG: ATP-binding protein [Defluviitaleaceae bacterium]|nr:ATP-binding protein [Defluviitaleaceae bacterium]